MLELFEGGFIVCLGFENNHQALRAKTGVRSVGGSVLSIVGWGKRLIIRATYHRMRRTLDAEPQPQRGAGLQNAK
jgi:hypothetical protein